MIRIPHGLTMVALGCLALQTLPAHAAEDDLRKEIAAQKARLEALEKRLGDAEAARSQTEAPARATAQPAPKKGLSMPDGLSIYGIADAGIEAGAYGHGLKVRMQSGLASASRLGFKGERSFSDDLNAYFQLEMGISIDNGQNSGHSSNVSNPGGGTLSSAAPNTTGVAVFSRNTFLGLHSKSLGDVRVGRDYAPIYNTMAISDPFGIGGATAFRLWSSAALSRMDNALFYSTPGWNGMKLSLAYSAGMENNNEADLGPSGGIILGANSRGPSGEGKGFSGSLSYNKGPLFLALGALDYAKMGDVKAPATENARRTAWNLSGTYDFGSVKLYGQFLHGEDSQAGLANPVSLKRNIWWVGASGEVAKGHTLRAVYSQLNDLLPTNRDSTQYGIGYEYALDKQTDLYLFYAQVSNQNGGSNSLCAGGTCQGYDAASGLPANYTPRSVMTGARYRF